MKIRAGFVSNSSSSSFCFIGIKTTLADIDETGFRRGEKYFAEMDELFEGEGGRVIVWITNKKVLDFMKKYGHVDTVYQTLIYAYDGDIKDITSLPIPYLPPYKRLMFGGFEIDQNSPSDIEGVKELYEYADIYEYGKEPKFIRLEHTWDGHNKYYELEKLDDNTWQASYGEIGYEPTYKKYDMSRWTEKLSEKLKKGYEKVSER